MVTIERSEEAGIRIINISGRIDGMTSSEVQRQLEEIILKGERHLIIDLKRVNYISSAGLRVFLIAQKQVVNISGKIVLYQVPENVFKVFNMSGFTTLFDFCATREDIEKAFKPATSSAAITTQEIDGVEIHLMRTPAVKGMVQLIGSQDKLIYSEFTSEDVVSVTSSDFQFATGLATLGDNYEDYKAFFGEAIVLNHSMFFYPAVRRPAVDYILSLEGDVEIDYRFFHGFGFNGSYQHCFAFEKRDGFVGISNLVDIALNISDSNLIGVVFLAESKGIWGMNLKSVPIIENKPKNSKDIFDPQNFSEWMNFPVEASDINNIIAGVGVAVKEPNALKTEMTSLFSENSNFHIHGGIFSKGPVSKNIDDFETELNRIMSELEMSKVQHLQGKTLFSSGLAAIIELEE